MLADEYNERINNNRKFQPTLMDRKAFRKLGTKLTHYAIEKAMAEWRATKDFQDAIDNGNEEPFVFDEAVGCLYECELPLRYGLPCKHWMLPFYQRGRPLPLSLFHPRWLLDGPSVVQSWKMSSSSGNTLVVAVEVDSLPGSKSSSPLLPEKLGILQKIPGRTSVIPENQGNNTGFSPPKARYQDDGA